MQTLLLELDGMTSCLHGLAVAAAGLAPGLSCGITVRSDTVYWSAASSNGWADQLDAAQHATAEGPGPDTLHTGKAVHSSDVPSEPRWPGFTDAAHRQGVRAALSLPVSSADRTVASLSLYAFGTVDVFGPGRTRHYQAVAAQVGLVLGLVTRTPDAGSYLSELEAGLPGRTIINQAVGVVMGRDGLAAAEALDVLRDEAHGHQQHLQERATTLIAQMSGTPWWPAEVTKLT